MSLAIEVDDVTSVLLTDGWHKVIDKSFEIDAYEFTHEKELRVGGGQVEGVSSTGVRWKEPEGSWIACPFERILAVRYLPEKRDKK